MGYETITLETDARGVARLTLNRPDSHNALSAEMITELKEAVQALAQAQEVRVVVLTGAGASFCAGGDLGWMRAQMAADTRTRAAQARALAEMLAALNALPKPVIGRIQGPAYGGGIGMIAVCDLAIGVLGAKFQLSETRLGLIPATIGPHVVARIGVARARRFFLSGRAFDAREAVELGLLVQAVAPEDLDAAIEAEIAPFLAAAPGAIAAAKALLMRLGGAPDPQTVADSVAALVERWESDEAKEGISAFFERRKHTWARG